MGNQDSMSHLLSRERQFAKVGPSRLASPPGRHPVVEEAPDQAALGCGRAAMIIDMR